MNRDEELKRIVEELKPKLEEDNNLLERLANAVEDRTLLNDPDLQASIEQMQKGQGLVINTECDYPDKHCLICEHKACGWCSHCSSWVPEWD